MGILYFVASFIFGSVIGSFLNVVILRLPESQSLGGRSRCPSCAHILGFLDLAPLFSFIFLFGRCRYCKTKISPRYLIIELITGLLFALSWLFLNPAGLLGFILLFKFWFIAAVLIVVFVIDLEYYLILDTVIFPALVVVILANLVLDVASGHAILSIRSLFISGLFGAVAGAVPFWLIWFFSKGKWMGFGDVKLALFLGAALGYPLIAVGLMLGIILGGVFSVFLLVFSKKTLKSQIPFGTFLSLGAILALFYGQTILHWYLAILGF